MSDFLRLQREAVRGDGGGGQGVPLDGPNSSPGWGDRGSGAIAVILFAMLFLALAAFVVDGGMAIAKRERAADLAEQAARFAAQDVNIEEVRNSANLGATAPINYTMCRRDIRKFLATAGVDPRDVGEARCVRPTNARQVTVQVHLTYTPMMTGFFFDGEQHAVGEASAESLTG